MTKSDFRDETHKPLIKFHKSEPSNISNDELVDSNMFKAPKGGLAIEYDYLMAAAGNKHAAALGEKSYRNNEVAKFNVSDCEMTVAVANFVSAMRNINEGKEYCKMRVHDKEKRKQCLHFMYETEHNVAEDFALTLQEKCCKGKVPMSYDRVTGRNLY